MPLSRASASWLVVTGLCWAGLPSACGGSGPEPKTPATAAAESEAKQPEEPESVAASEERSNQDQDDSTPPTECALKDPCRPPGAWVDRLCQNTYPGLALYLFQSKQPWVRRYLTRKTEAINASGGMTREGWLEFDEEVLVLRMKKASADGIQVSGATESYLALRWDGSCVTLSGEEVTERPPPAAKHSFVTWRFLDDNIQQALKADDGVREGHRARQKECKGATTGTVSKPCVKADQRLNDLVVEYIRRGGEVPVPVKLP